MLFSLYIAYIIQTTDQIKILASQFSTAKILCAQDKVLFISDDETAKTYHSYKLPKGDWNCILIVEKDGQTVSRSFTTER